MRSYFSGQSFHQSRISARLRPPDRHDNLAPHQGAKMPFFSNLSGATVLRAIIVVLLLLLIAHAPMILNDSLYMDDWLVLKARPDFTIDYNFLLSSAGHPIFFSYDYVANFIGRPVLFMKILAFSGILSGSVCLILTGTRLNLLTRLEAVGGAVIVWTYPGYQMWAGKANAVYVLSFGLFFVGVWLLALAFSIGGSRHIVLRTASAIAFLFSFALNSTMVLYAFAMFGLFVAFWRNSKKGQGLISRMFSSALRCVKAYPEFVVLPLVYWITLNVLFKRVGVYADHYDAHFPTLQELIDGWQVFFLSGYGDLLWNTARSILNSRTPFILAAILVIASFLLLRPGSERDEAKHSIALPLLLCPALFFALSLPYLIAGLRPAENFYETRHLLMFGIPLALGLLAIKRLLELALGARVAFAAIFGAASILSIAMLWNDYIFMQARALKLESLFDHLANMPRPPATVFNIIDGWMDYPSQYSPAGSTEFSNMLRLAWGNQPFFGFTLRAERPTVLQEMETLRSEKGSAFANMDPTGPQATILFQPGPAAAPNAVLVRHYYACRLLGRCDVSEFLTQLATVKIDVGPIAGVKPIEHSN
jgi:hypothetical protein